MARIQMSAVSVKGVRLEREIRQDIEGDWVYTENGHVVVREPSYERCQRHVELREAEINSGKAPPVPAYLAQAKVEVVR